MFDEKKLTKKIDLEAHDGLSAYLTHVAQQNHNVFEVFYSFLNEIRPKRILEIGTALGGFTNFLKLVSDENDLNINIRSYDINRASWYVKMVENGIDVRVENIFNTTFTDINQEVKEFITEEGTTLILCDGGNKKLEFNILSDFMKPGDFIMGHDYARDFEVFKEKINGKIWNWFELQESDIAECCDRNNLINYNQDIFDNVVWVCKTKI